jgi:cell wall-associated NlpC family hydrolase
MRRPTLSACLLLALVLCACTAQGPRRAPAPAVPPPAMQTHAANAVLFRAMDLVGTPYRSGGNTPATGFDCSGLVDYVFADTLGMALPRTAAAIARADGREVDRDALESGDLVLFHGHGRTITHVGIYVGEGRFVHAPNKGGTVRLDRLDDTYWREHYGGAKRVLGHAHPIER